LREDRQGRGGQKKKQARANTTKGIEKERELRLRIGPPPWT